MKWLIFCASYCESSYFSTFFYIKRSDSRNVKRFIEIAFFAIRIDFLHLCSRLPLQQTKIKQVCKILNFIHFYIKLFYRNQQKYAGIHLWAIDWRKTRIYIEFCDIFFFNKMCHKPYKWFNRIQLKTNKDEKY